MANLFIFNGFVVLEFLTQIFLSLTGKEGSVNVHLGPWLFITQRCLITSSQSERELDPLSFKLLTYFIANETRIVARQELVDQVWQQTFVDDNAINRAISELRKQLSHPELKSGIIKTHYRKGYSLTVDVIKEVEESKKNVSQDDGPQAISGLGNITLPSQQASNAVLTNNVSPGNLMQEGHTTNVNRHSSILLRIIIGLVFLVCVMAGFLIWQNSTELSDLANAKTSYMGSQSTQTSKQYNYTVTSATWNNGGESNPLVSHQQQFFAYSNIHQGIVKTFVKRLSDQVEVALNVPEHEIGGLSWQQGQQKLLALLVNSQSRECHYALFDMSAYPVIEQPTKLKRCDPLKNGYAQLDKQAENLFYTQRDEGFSGSAIYQFDLQSKREKVLVPPSDNWYGAVQLNLSPDGQYLAYLWSQIKSPMKVYLMNLTTRENELLYEMSHDGLRFSLDWFADGEHLLTSERDNLLKINIKTKTLETVKLPNGYKPFYLALEFDNQVLFSQSDAQQYQLIKGQGLFSNTTPTLDNPHESESSDFAPEASSADTQLHYFVSQRTGTNQIWRSTDNETKQITFLDSNPSRRISHLRLSRDNKRLLFLQGTSLQLIDLESQQVHLVSELTDIDLVNFEWGKQAHEVYFIHVDNGHKTLKLFNLMTRKIAVIATNDIGRLYANGAGGVFYLSAKALVNVETGNNIPITIPSNGFVFADMNERYFYGTDALFSLYRMSLTTGEVQKVTLPFRQRNFNVVDDDTVIFTKRQYKNTSIKRVSWN